MASDPLKEAAHHMARSVEIVVREFSGVRTGKASPALLDTVRVEAYETTMALNQLANVSAPEPQLLVVQPYDPKLAGTIARAIQSSDLGLNPSVDAQVIRVPIPPLTEDRRKEMVKVLHRMAEEGRIAVRHVRQNTKSDLQKRQKDGELSEDELHRRLETLQQLTDEHVGKIDELLRRKEAEVMEV
ncbi:MAG: ribosome recycling factor [Gemmatimonadota bacterium]